MGSRFEGKWMNMGIAMSDVRPGWIDAYKAATSNKPIEPGHCALCGQKPETRPKTLGEFCAFWRMSRDKFYDLAAQGKAPTVTKVGGRLLITREAEEEWCRKLPNIVAPCGEL
jgi:predicted DNA-binding transcriptional regulator AlpA